MRRMEEHNNITEGRCVVLAVQRMTRCRKGRDCRMLVVTDSQVVVLTELLEDLESAHGHLEVGVTA